MPTFWFQVVMRADGGELQRRRSLMEDTLASVGKAPINVIVDDPPPGAGKHRLVIYFSAVDADDAMNLSHSLGLVVEEQGLSSAWSQGPDSGQPPDPIHLN